MNMLGTCGKVIVNKTTTTIAKGNGKIEDINNRVSYIKNELSRLHEAFMVDIDEVNAELEYNFGWPIFGHVHGTQVTEDVED